MPFFAARVTDKTGHPGVIAGPGVPKVLIGGLPPTGAGHPQLFAFAALGWPHPTNQLSTFDWQQDGSDRRSRRITRGRYFTLRRTNRHRGEERDHWRVTNGSCTYRMADKAFLGVGWSFPVAIPVEGSVELAVFEEDI